MLIDLAGIVNYDGFVLPIAYTVGQEQTEEVRLAAPVEVTGSLKNYSGDLVLKLNASARIIVECDRCLEPAEIDCGFELDAPVVLAESDNPDCIVAENGKLDVDLVCIEALLSSLPLKRLCREDCKGLCPVCGTNLNQKQCGCNDDYGDSPFAALKTKL